MIKAYSFDVFDTTLTRVVARPKDIFVLVQAKLEELQIGLPEKIVKRFAVIRERSAFRVRLLKRVEDITIYDIYSYIGKRYGLSDKVAADLVNLEIETELESVYPVQGSISEIEKLREGGAKILFTSDNYLPEETIKNMLLKVGAYRPGDAVYVSGAIGLTKIWGSMYKYILEREHCSARELSHYGDNPYSDVFVPAKIGIQIYEMSPDKLKGFFNTHRIYGFIKLAMVAIKRFYLK